MTNALKKASDARAKALRATARYLIELIERKSFDAVRESVDPTRGNVIGHDCELGCLVLRAPVSENRRRAAMAAIHAAGMPVWGMGKAA